jgi:ectoine hydroxylase-related dioxygenase (phytanoyl-CoA dioxygenase family)
VLPIIVGVPEKECLISSISSIAIDPGEAAHPIHADVMAIPMDKPHRPLVRNSIWALSDFTEANGATRIALGAHRLQNPEYAQAYKSIPLELAKGSVLIWEGALCQGGGANRTGARRTGLAMN